MKTRIEKNETVCLEKVAATPLHLCECVYVCKSMFVLDKKGHHHLLSLCSPSPKVVFFFTNMKGKSLNEASCHKFEDFDWK